MPFPVHNGAHSAGVTASGDHAKVAGLELDRVHDLVGVDIQPDRVVGLDNGVRVPDGPSVTGVQVGHIFRSCLDIPDTAQLVLGLLDRKRFVHKS